MFISKRKFKELEKRVADLEVRAQSQQVHERIENGDIYFPFCKNKGNCDNCEAVIDKGNDKFCWKCGARLS